MQLTDTVRALRVDNIDGQHHAVIDELPFAGIGQGELVVRVEYSAVNYKDALAGTGGGRILRRLPLIPGVDMAGEVLADASGSYAVGDKVLVTGCGLGESSDGGFATHVRVPATWAVPLPASLTTREVMLIGTAGFTAALAMLRLQEAGLDSSLGPVLVTGARGGVGSFAIDLLSRLNYRVVALSRQDDDGYLAGLGADEVIAPQAIAASGKPLDKARWGGVIDTVGGELLSALLPQIAPWGSVASIGLAGGAAYAATVMPHILRGVSILGVSSANAPMPRRLAVWERLAGAWRPTCLDAVHSATVGLDQLPQVFEQILAGQHRGRTLVAMHD